MSDDEDEEDLWGTMDEPDNNLMVSANLAQVVGVEEKKVHAGEPDEGQVRWVAPSFAGLSNSDTVDVKGGHWNKDEKAAMPSPPVGMPAVPPTPSTAKAMPPAILGGMGASLLPSIVQQPQTPGPPTANPAFVLPQSADGRIDWGAMAANAAAAAK